MLGDHVVSLGFVVCFSPYIFETVLSTGFIIMRTVYEVRKQKFEENTRIIKMGKNKFIQD